MFRLSPGKDASHQVVFDIHAVIHGCSNIPHPDAQVYCKWRLTSATFVHSGITETCGVLSANRVAWDAPLTITNCILKLEPRTKPLKRCKLRISIRQLAHASAGGYTRLGVVTVDLAEYLGGNKITRSFLLEDSRLNSTLNITIHSEQVRGDVMFRRKTPDPVSTDVEGDETAQPEQGPVRQKASSPPRLAQQQSALQAVEDIVRELGATRANTPTLQQDQSPA